MAFGPRFPAVTRAVFTKASGAGPGVALNVNLQEARFLIAAKEVVAPTAAANTVAPVRSGVAQVGVTMSVTQGTWTGANLAYTYQWQSNNGSGRFEDIASASKASTFVVQQAQFGHTIRAVVIATNAAGPVAVATAASGAVIAA
jgi:hypothetical protein